MTNSQYKDIQNFSIIKKTLQMFFLTNKHATLITITIITSIILLKVLEFKAITLNTEILTQKTDQPSLNLILYLFINEVVSSFLQELKKYIFAKHLSKYINILSVQAFKNIISDDFIDLDKFKNGHLQTTINIGCKGFAKLVSVLILNIFPVLVGLYLLIADLMFKTDFKICILFMIPVIFCILLDCYFEYKRMLFKFKLNLVIARGNKLLFEVFTNIEAVKYHDTNEVEICRYRKIMTEYERMYRKYNRMSAFNAFFNRFFYSLLKLFLFINLSGLIKINDRISKKYLDTIVKSLERNTTNTGNMISKCLRNIVCSNSVIKILEKKRSIPMNKKISGINTISFKNVSIYRNNDLIFDNLNLTVKAGEKVAIIGLNGCGKSSIFHAMLKFVDYKGSIKINGINIKSLNCSFYRKLIGYLPQNAYIFDETLDYNLLYGSDKFKRNFLQKYSYNEQNLHKKYESLNDKRTKNFEEKQSNTNKYTLKSISNSQNTSNTTPINFIQSSAENNFAVKSETNYTNVKESTKTGKLDVLNESYKKDKNKFDDSIICLQENHSYKNHLSRKEPEQNKENNNSTTFNLNKIKEVSKDEKLEGVNSREDCIIFNEIDLASNDIKPYKPTEIIESTEKEKFYKKILKSLNPKNKNKVGESGNALSGGEKRKIMISRLLHSEYDMYMLDEPFSFLDKETEELVFEYYMNLNGIVFMILHSTKYLDRFNKVVYVRNGSVFAEDRTILNDDLDTSIESEDLD